MKNKELTIYFTKHDNVQNYPVVSSLHCLNQSSFSELEYISLYFTYNEFLKNSNLYRHIFSARAIKNIYSSFQVFLLQFQSLIRLVNKHQKLLYTVKFNKESYRHSSRKTKAEYLDLFLLRWQKPIKTASTPVYTITLHFKMEMGIFPHHKCNCIKMIFYISKLMFTRSN